MASFSIRIHYAHINHEASQCRGLYSTPHAFVKLAGDVVL
jgi:hypothetical protein